MKFSNWNESIIIPRCCCGYKFSNVALPFDLLGMSQGRFLRWAHELLRCLYCTACCLRWRFLCHSDHGFAHAFLRNALLKAAGTLLNTTWLMWMSWVRGLSLNCRKTSFRFLLRVLVLVWYCFIIEASAHMSSFAPRLPRPNLIFFI